MHEYLNVIYLHIFWMITKNTYGGWEGSRKTTSHHTIYWVHEGLGTFTSSETVQAAAGTLLYASPGMEVQYRSDPDRPMKFSIIRFECIACKTAEGTWRNESVDHLAIPFFISAQGSDRLELDRLFEKLLMLWNPASPGGEVLSKSALTEILLNATRIHEKSKVKHTGHAAFDRIKEALELQYHHTLNIEKLARSHGISPVYLRKLFHTKEGCTPKQYLDRIRHQHASRLLLHSDLPIRMIAEACGYTDEFHFSKVFKKITGHAPSMCREIMSN